MATTITLGGSINWAQSFGGFKQLTIGTANEPAITSANIILTTVLSPPFCWNWNRDSVTFPAATGVQDYVVDNPTFGFIEKASFIAVATVTGTVLDNNIMTYSMSIPFTTATSFVPGALVTVTGLVANPVGNIVQQPILTVGTNYFTVALTGSNVATFADNGTATVGKAAEITNVQNVLAIGNEAGSPVFIAPQVDDNDGNITYRLLPVPDQPYQITVIYQNRIPALMNSTSSTWAPIPDHYSNIYQWGFLSVIAAYFEDPRWAPFTQKFVSTILSMAEGLEQADKDTFQKTWLDMISETSARGIKTQQGAAQRQI